MRDPTKPPEAIEEVMAAIDGTPRNPADEPATIVFLARSVVNATVARIDRLESELARVTKERDDLRRQGWKIAKLTVEDWAPDSWSAGDKGDYVMHLLERAGFDFLAPCLEKPDE